MTNALHFALHLLLIALPGAMTRGLEADIVIVGGGTAGCVLAARLCTALPAQRIVVLEKGAPKRPKHNLLRKSIRLQFDVTRQPFVDRLESEPVPAFNGRRMTVPVGTGYGGASNVNGGFLGTASNRAYARIFTHMKLPEIRAAKARMRATARVGFLFPDGSPFSKVLQSAVANARLNTTKYVNPATQPVDDRRLSGTIFTRNGMRQSIDESYLDPVRSKCKNLTLLNDVLVDRVQFELGAAGMHYATGVHVITDGTKRSFVKARREVIVSAGSIYSAALLQRSGIGETGLLRKLGVTPRVDLKVGFIRNKIMTLAFGKYKRPKGSRLNDPSYYLSPESKRTFWAGKGGPLGIGPFGGGGSLTVPGGICPFSISAEGRLLNQNPPFNPKAPGRLTSVCMCPSDSDGKIEARSKDPQAPPKMTLNFVNSPFDVSNVRRCAGVLDKIFKSFAPELQAVKTFPAGGLENYEWKNATSSSYHLSGACAIGRVLDNWYQVKGTQKLRVVDSSAVPPGYPDGLFGATMIIAEHASTLLIRRYNGSF